MTGRQLYLLARRRFTQEGLDAPGNDAALLAQRFLGLDRTGLAVHGEEPVDSQGEESFLRAVEERSSRLPLQYILGQWEFMGMDLAVGEGVLCPREDTAVLVEELSARLKGNPAPVGLDLCAGTGAVGLGLLTLCPGARFQAVELSPQALPYLEENLKRYGGGQAAPLTGDVLSASFAGSFPRESLDFLASNPPYIPRGELNSLQPEVQREPVLALDGGGDGLTFYRAIGELWVPALKPGGALAVEIGETQASAVAEIFQQFGVTDVEIRRDWAGLDRVVSGRKAPAL